MHLSITVPNGRDSERLMGTSQGCVAGNELSITENHFVLYIKLE